MVENHLQANASSQNLFWTANKPLPSCKFIRRHCRSSPVGESCVEFTWGSSGVSVPAKLIAG